ncbi:DinB family protein [Nocardia thailandica]
MSTNRITDGPERVLLESALDRTRAALVATARGLSEADARRRLVPSLTTPLSLLKHAAAAERIWFQRFWAGLDEEACDGYARRDLGTFAVTDDESLAGVVAEFERASARSREIAARFALDDTRDIPGEGVISLRWTLLAMIEEFARHAGHGDILREQIDASTRDRPNSRVPREPSGTTFLN